MKIGEPFDRVHVRIVVPFHEMSPADMKEIRYWFETEEVPVNALYSRLHDMELSSEVLQAIYKIADGGWVHDILFIEGNG